MAGEKGEPNLSKYYPVSNEASLDDLPEITLKNVSLAMILLGFIAFMVNALMVFIFMRQEWAVIWPQTGGAQVGTVLVIFGIILYVVNHLIERKLR
jgi:peptidoglycan biosynthesis protein MviN/MurJ (putative lipid II flippase)